MPTPPEMKAPFSPGNFYHMICKSTDGIFLFKDPVDFNVYTRKFYKYTNLFLENWGYSLLHNHSHHVLKIKSADVIAANLSGVEKRKLTIASKVFLRKQNEERVFDRMIERQMNSFLVSYAQYYNIKYERKGGLFQKPFRRISINDDTYLQQAIIYAHINPQKHGLVENFASYSHCSYSQVIAGDDSKVAGKNIVEFFGGISNFEQLHYDKGCLPCSNTPILRLE